MHIQTDNINQQEDYATCVDNARTDKAKTDNARSCVIFSVWYNIIIIDMYYKTEFLNLLGVSKASIY